MLEQSVLRPYVQHLHGAITYGAIAGYQTPGSMDDFKRRLVIPWNQKI